MTSGDQVVGYVRVSTADQGANGYGLDAQRSAIEAECSRKDWQLVRIFEDVASGKTTNRRPGLKDAITTCERGYAGGLIASKVDRVSRSVADFADLLQRARRKGWNLVVLDLGIDLSSPMGEAMASMAVTFAQLERRLISERTKVALATAKAQGVRLGRPRSLPEAVMLDILSAREGGQTLTAIAKQLNAAGIATAQGGTQWWAGTVAAVLKSRRTLG
jgi:DNA invertase Pin-like site-specific DNA recombinase